GLVQRNIEHRLCEERPADSARYKQRDKSDGEQHWRCKPNPAAPKGAQPIKRLDRRTYTDGHSHDGEGKGRIGADSASEHVLSPDHESEHADRKHGVYHCPVAKNRLAP